MARKIRKQHVEYVSIKLAMLATMIGIVYFSYQLVSPVRNFVDTDIFRFKSPSINEIIVDDGAKAESVSNEPEVAVASPVQLDEVIAAPEPVISKTEPTNKSEPVNKPKAVNVSTKKVVVSPGGGIGKSGPIRYKTKIVGGKTVCDKSNDHPQKSTKNPKGHIDSECCLDPDETPNSNCYYSPAKYGKMIQKYLNSRK